MGRVLGEIKLLKENQNVLLGRKEIEFEVLHEKASSPSRLEVREKLASMLNVNPESVYIIKMITKANTWKTIGIAHVYNSPEKAKILIPKHLLLRSIPKEEKEKLKEKKTS